MVKFIIIGIIFMVIVLALGGWKWNTQVEKELNALMTQNVAGENIMMTEEMIKDLPSPVKRWLRNSGILNHEQIHTMYLEQTGFMKLKPDQEDWMKATSEQYITIDKPGFLWKVNISMMPLINVVGRDLFEDAKGQMQIKIASLIPVVDVKNNKKTDKSTLQRYLMEIMWYPSAAIADYITWESIDENSAKATMTYNGVSGSVIFYFDEKGQVRKCSALRYKDNDENVQPIECIGEIKESRVISGLNIPTKIDISWMLEEGKFTWYKLEVQDVFYNLNDEEKEI